MADPWRSLNTRKKPCWGNQLMNANSRADGFSTQPSPNCESTRVEEAGPKERRTAPRVATDCLVQWWKPGDRYPRRGQLKDISAGGCYIETPVPVAVGTAVIVGLTLGELKKKVKAVGEVRFYKPQKGMGISFTLIERVCD